MISRKIKSMLVLFGFNGSVLAQAPTIVVPIAHNQEIVKVVVDRENKFFYTADDAKVIMWDFKTMTQLYSFTIASTSTGAGIANTVNNLKEFCISPDGKTIAFTTAKDSLKVYSTTSGRLVKTIPGVSSRITFSKDSKTIYDLVAARDKDNSAQADGRMVRAIDIATGNINWPKTKLDDPIANVLFDDNGVLVATDDKKSELFLFDYATGSPKWSEPLKIAGRISSIKLTGTKLAVGASKQNGRNIVSVVDITTGKSLTASPLKVDGYILDLRLIDNVGLLYRTNQECNVLDLNTGKEQWSKSIKYSSGGLGLDKGDFTYFIGDNSIYEVNNKNGDHKEFANKKFGKEEIFRTIELMDQGIIVSSDQNVAMFNYAGSIVYHAYHPAPGISTFGKIMNIAAMGVSMAASASEGYQAGASGYGTSSYKSGMERADRWSNVASAAMSDLSKRFSASANAKNYKLVLTKVTTSDDSGVGLVRINKLTGKVDGKVVLDDKKPDYLFDEIENMLFYKDGNKKLVAYNFNK